MWERECTEPLSGMVTIEDCKDYFRGFKHEDWKVNFDQSSGFYFCHHERLPDKEYVIVIIDLEDEFIIRFAGPGNEESFDIALIGLSLEEIADRIRNGLDGLGEKWFSQEEEECGCGTIKKSFMHNCSGTSNMVEIVGCPVCDDHCGFCE